MASDVFILSAFLDARANDVEESRPKGSIDVRMMAITPATAQRRRRQTAANSLMERLPKLRCLFPLYDYSKSSGSAKMYLRSPVTYYKMTEKEKSHAGYILSCRLPPALLHRPPCEIQVTDDAMDTAIAPWIRVESQRPQRRHRFSVCTPPLYGDIDVKNLIEFIEMSRLLGAEHFYLYDYNTTASVNHVLSYYSRVIGIATVIPWKLDSRFETGDRLWNNGRIVTTNDCLYRSMATSQFVVFLDIDEILLSYLHRNWTSMTRYLQTKSRTQYHAGYVFRSVVFDPYRQIRHDDNMVYLRSLTDTLRSSFPSPSHTRCLVNPRDVFYQRMTGIGRPIMTHLKQFLVHPADAVVRHYRPCNADGDELQCTPVVKDTLTYHYSDELQSAVEYVLSYLWPDELG